MNFRNCLLSTFISFLLFSISSCSSKTNVDLLVHNGRIYTIDSSFSVKEAMVIKDGKIVRTGSNQDLMDEFDAEDSLNAEGKFIYPGFIDAHAHFYNYGLDLQTVKLDGTESWQECIEKINQYNGSHTPEKGRWILGRGWDQNDWKVKEFPSRETLDSLFPDNPVLLTRVDGHAAIANDAALRISGIQPGQSVPGGLIETKNGKLTGILIDNAIELVESKVPLPSFNQVKESLLGAQKNCFEVGLTSITDCGLDYTEVNAIDSLQKMGELKMRLYVMLSDGAGNYSYLFSKGKIKTDRLHVRSFKLYGDGALGSRGACLLQPYADRADWFGFLLSPASHFDSVASVLYAKGFQMCTHAIGDSGNRVILNVYGNHLKGKNDLRWRIEHAQVVNQNDFDLFGRYSIIPSVQPTHTTSDMYWAEARVGKERIKGAYAFNDLRKQNGWIPLGTDFPVEDISPFKTFFAAVFRKDAKGWPEGGFQIENALSREDALRGMTIWAARANFEENEKGSLENGKFADFVILDKDLMQAPEAQILRTNVLYTYVNGEKVFGK